MNNGRCPPPDLIIDYEELRELREKHQRGIAFFDYPSNLNQYD